MKGKTRKPLPCPFCGGEILVDEKSGGRPIRQWGSHSSRVHAIQCVQCDALGPTGHTSLEARELWNNAQRKEQK